MKEDSWLGLGGRDSCEAANPVVVASDLRFEPELDRRLLLRGERTSDGDGGDEAEASGGDSAESGKSTSSITSPPIPGKACPGWISPFLEEALVSVRVYPAEASMVAGGPGSASAAGRGLGLGLGRRGRGRRRSSWRT